MSEVAVWSCEFANHDGPGGGTLETLTVGMRFKWKCKGDVEVNWDADVKPILSFKDEKDTYALEILKVVAQEPTQAEYEVTAYKSGTHAPEYIRVLQHQGTPQEKGFEVLQAQWTVASVLDPKQQPPQPFPPFGPWQLAFPQWFLVFVLLSLLLISYLVVRRVRRFNQRRRILEELRLHKTALSPLHQFYRDARLLRRRLHTAQSQEDLLALSTALNREFRLFVLRRFQIPTLDWNNSMIVSELKRRDKKAARRGMDVLKSTLRELDKVKARSNLTPQDVEQLHRMSLDAAERLESGSELR